MTWNMPEGSSLNNPYDDDGIVCDECEFFFDVDKGEYVDLLKWVCNDCLEEHYTQCHNCKKWHKNEGVEDYDGYKMCEDCIEDLKQFLGDKGDA